jgi:hypothetical protein
MRGVGDEVAAGALEARLGGDVAQDDDRGEVGGSGDRIGSCFEGPLAVHEDDRLRLVVAARIAPRLGDVGREGLVEPRADADRLVQKLGGGRVGDSDGAFVREADDALTQVVQQHLDAVALVLDLSERAAQPDRHHVEGRGELPDLVFDGGRHRGREVTGGDGLCATLDAFQASGDEVRGQIAKKETDAHGEDGGEEELALDGGHCGVDVPERRDDEHHPGHCGRADVRHDQRHGRGRVAAGARGHHSLHHLRRRKRFGDHRVVAHVERVGHGPGVERHLILREDDHARVEQVVEELDRRRQRSRVEVARLAR